MRSLILVALLSAPCHAAVTSIVGAKGVTGVTGATGNTGPTGATGSTGPATPFTVSGNVATYTNGNVATTYGVSAATMTLGTSDVIRDDASLNITGAQRGLSINDNSASATNTEAWMTFMAKDSAAAWRKRMSISSLWVDNTAGSGFANLRFNATYSGGQLDDIFLTGYGRQGATFFPLTPDADYPGDKILWVRGQTKTDTGVVVSTLTVGSAAQTGYSLSVRGGGSLLGATDMVAQALLDGAGTKGILVGFDSAEAVGTLSCASASCGTAFWTHDGAGWAERGRFHTNGFFGIGTATPGLALDVVGSIRSTGPVTASAFLGSGAQLTALTPGNMSAGALTAGVSIPASGVDLSTVTTALALKAPLASPAFTGSITIGSGGTPLAVVSTGSYTPSLTNTTNVAASVAHPTRWTRIGNLVHVSGQVEIDPTEASGTFTQLDISLPVASNFTSQYDGDGTANIIATTTAGGMALRAEAATDVMNFYWWADAANAGSTGFVFQFDYEIK